MKRFLIIQARMTSSRLPGKVLMDIGGQPMLERVVQRARRAAQVHGTIVATSSLPADDPVADSARALGVEVFRGSEQDVLDRFYKAAKKFQADAIVRVTADCPLIDPGLIDEVITAFQRHRPWVDFAANTLTRTYPRGLDVEVASFNALQRAWKEARAEYHRAHVFPFVYEHPEKFALCNVTQGEDHSWMRWTVDTEADLEFVRAVYARLNNALYPTWHEVLEVLHKEPALIEINRQVQQKPAREG